MKSTGLENSVLFFCKYSMDLRNSLLFEGMLYATIKGVNSLREQKEAVMYRICIGKETQAQLDLRKEKERLLVNEGIYGANGFYLLKNGKPWYPIMGEFHFSRFRPEFWREEIAKMKAGGIEVMATYVFWIHHEEKQGEWNFSGQRDIRRFLQVCQEEKMPLFLRIGPWAHGECRNGGFPNWLMERKDLSLRSDDPGYLDLVRIFWKRLFKEVNGFLFYQNGPIIGIQIENEYGHCGGLQGEPGMRHMKALKQMAREIGFSTPYYTATGWGGGIVPEEECLPVLAAYCGAPWEQNTRPLPPNNNFLFSHYKNDANVGSDLHVGEETGFTYNTEKMPYLMAELGGGLQVTGHRRPYVTAEDIAAMSLCKFGSGANLLGYYMYHGGTNPKGKYSALQETGNTNELPVRSYDFQAPLGEYGHINESYYKLRPLHMFLHDFGEISAEGESILPAWNTEIADDEENPRVAFRHIREKAQGFLIYNRHQRHGNPKSLELTVEVETLDQKIQIPKISMKENTWGWIPYAAEETEGMELTPEFHLYTANAMPLCSLGNDVVFFGEEDAEITWQGTGNVILISREEAEHSFKYKDKLYVSEGCLAEEGEQLYLYSSQNENTVTVYPEKIKKQFSCEKAGVSLEIKETQRRTEYVEYQLQIGRETDNIHDLWILLDFVGDRGTFWVGTQAGNQEQPDGDWYYQGKSWNISCKYLNWPENITVRIYPVKSSKSVYYEKYPEGKTGIRNIKIQPEYKIRLK